MTWFPRPLLLLALGTLALSACTPKATDSAATTTTSASTQPATGPELVLHPMLKARVYTDGVSIVVEQVPLARKGNTRAQALVRISGIESIATGITFLVTRTKHNNLDAWEATVDGQSAFLLASQPQRTLGHDEIVLYVPRGHGGITVHLDPEAAEAVDTAELIADYQKNLANGTLARLAEFDREYAVRIATEQIAPMRKEFAKQCGKQLAVDFVWESFADHEAFSKTNFCMHAVSKLAQLCEDGLSLRTEIVERLERVRCTLGDQENYSYSASSKTWNITSKPALLVPGTKAQRLASEKLGLERTVIKSDAGLYIVIPTPHDEEPVLYAGVGPKLYRQQGKKYGRRTGQATWDGVADTTLRMIAPGKWIAQCPRSEVAFTEVSFAERDRVLTSSSFEDTIWKRQSVVLARDDRGIYYYVDKLRPEHGGLGYRVFRGPRGRLSLTTMVDLVDDSYGQIFATTSGSLRLMLLNGAEEARWLVGKKSEDLAIVNAISRRKLIYGDLGIYAGQELGTICSLAYGSEIGP